MRQLSIVGGIYLETCIQPLWNAIYGSAGRAAQAVPHLVSQPLKLFSYLPDDFMPTAARLAEECGAILTATRSSTPIGFEYLHPLSSPIIRPSVAKIAKSAAISVSGDVVLRYGMLEGDAVVDADIAVYDPQSAFDVPHFSDNGSRAKRLAIVMNSREAAAMTGLTDPIQAADKLLNAGAEVVVVKRGAQGALVRTQSDTAIVPLFRTERVWKIGSGDVFSAVFSALWGCQNFSPAEAATLASKAAAFYCNSRSLPIPPVPELRSALMLPVSEGNGSIYLAAPFFDLGQRWLIEETRTILRNMGASVFSPAHEVGPGPADLVAPADIKGLNESDVVLAILNGFDPGTVFEVGYASRRAMPVIALSQNAREEDLKMVVGSGCEVTDDFASALYRALWALPPK